MEPLLRIGELARRTNVSMATLKFYVREGLVRPVKKTGRTMSWYAPSAVERVRAIKELQEERFLPLDVIRKALEKDGRAEDDYAAAGAIAAVLAKHTAKRTRTRAELLEGGRVTPAELDWLASAGLAVPGADGAYRDDDLALLQTLGAARAAGIVAEMLPFSILAEYLSALNRLVTAELQLYREGVVRRAKREDIGRLTIAATELSERLVVLLRRKLLVPTLHRLIEEESHEANRDPAAAERVRPQRHAKPARSRRPRRSGRRH